MAEPTGADDLLAEAWASLVGPAEDPRAGQGSGVTVTGPPGHLASRFRVEDAATACVGTALMAAARLGQPAGVTAPEVTLDRGHVSVAVVSERYFRQAGQATGAGFAPLSRFWPTADGWVRTHANYPWHRAALLGALGTSEDPEAVAAALRALPSEVVEERVVGAGGVAAAVRTVAEWRSHPQGMSLGTEPLISHQSLGEASPRARRWGGTPAAGVRVLDLTRVIAGPVCTRFLGALGADVLRVDPPAHPDMGFGARADTLLAKRSTVLDLTDHRGRATLHELLGQADVLVCGYRPGSLDRFGLGPDELAERHPGLVVVSLAAWGHRGPWAQRRGFDSVVQAPTGIAAAESLDGTTPGALPCQLLDHGTGYLAAAAALDGLRRQITHGGTHLRRISLARTAAWLTSSAAGGHGGPGEGRVLDPRPWVVDFVAAEGPIRAVAPPGCLDHRPLRWPGPPARYRSDPPTWMA